MSPQPSVLCIGEALWDLFPEGPQLGGAPLNVAVHAAALGLPSALLSRVGADDLGTRILDELQSRGVSTRYIQIDGEADTGTVRVWKEAEDVRYSIEPNAAWDRLVAPEPLFDELKDYPAICFGTLAQRTPEAAHAITTVLDTLGLDRWVVLDINLRPGYTEAAIRRSLERANVLKLNRGELTILAGMLRMPTNEQEFIDRIIDRYGYRGVALTRDCKGAIIKLDGEYVEGPGVEVEVIDPVGAGDAFTACLIEGLCRGRSAAEIARRANRVAAWVCTQAGATPRRIPDLFG